MKSFNILFIFSLISVFIAGFFVLWNGYIRLEVQPFENFNTYDISNSTCPDVLIHKDNYYLLYNTKEAQIEGKNPIKFNSISEYTQYMIDASNSGMNCPILFLQKEYDPQNKEVYKIQPSPYFVEGGLPALPLNVYDACFNHPDPIADASRENGFNQNMYPGYDPTSQYVGRFTQVDSIHNKTSKEEGGSVNPADDNWLGVIASQQSVDKGKFKDDEVYKIVQPNMSKTIVP